MQCEAVEYPSGMRYRRSWWTSSSARSSLQRGLSETRLPSSTRQISRWQTAAAAPRAAPPRAIATRPSAAGSRRASAQELSPRIAAASSAEATQAGHAVEPHQANLQQADATDGVKHALLGAEGHVSRGDGAKRCADRGSTATAAMDAQAAAGRDDKLAGDTALPARDVGRQRHGHAGPGACELDAFAAAAGPQLASDTTAVQVIAAIAADSPARPSNAADACQDEGAAQLLPLPWDKPRHGDVASETAPQANGSRLVVSDLLNSDAREHGTCAAAVATKPVAATSAMEEIALPACSPGPSSGAAAEACQDEIVAELIPVPWVGPGWVEEYTSAPTVQQAGLSAHFLPAGDAMAQRHAACIPVRMVSTCSSPPFRRPVKRARRYEQQMLCHTLDDGTADWCCDSGQRSGNGVCCEQHLPARRSETAADSTAAAHGAGTPVMFGRPC